MFLKNSRYAGLPTVSAADRAGHTVSAVTLRPLPAISGEPVAVRAHDSLDALADQRWRDATRWWRIADANTELEAASLLEPVGRPVVVPKS